MEPYSKLLKALALIAMVLGVATGCAANTNSQGQIQTQTQQTQIQTPIQTQTQNQTEVQSPPQPLTISIERPDGKAVEISFPDSKLRDGQLGASPDFYMYQLTKSPTADEFAFTGGFGLPYGMSGIWLIRGDQVISLLPLEINGIKFELSNESSTLYWANFFIWSPDGKQIAYTSNRRNRLENDIWVVKIEKGTHYLVETPERPASLVSWDLSGKITYNTFDGKTNMVDVDEE